MIDKIITYALKMFGITSQKDLVFVKNVALLAIILTSFVAVNAALNKDTVEIILACILGFIYSSTYSVVIKQIK